MKNKVPENHIRGRTRQDKFYLQGNEEEGRSILQTILIGENDSDSCTSFLHFNWH